MSHQPTQARRVALRDFMPWRRDPDGGPPRWISRLRSAFAAHAAAARAPSATSAYVVFAVVLLFPGALKLIKALGATEGNVRVSDLLAVTAPDVALALVTIPAVFALVGLCRWRRRGLWTFTGLTTLWLLPVLMLSALEHQAWARSGSLIDWKIFRYTIEHYAELRVVIAAETTAGGVLLLIGAALLALVPTVVDFVLARQLGVGPAPRWTPALVALALAVTCGWAARGAATAPELYPLTQSAAIGLLAGALESEPDASHGAAFRAESAERARARIEQALAAAQIKQDKADDKPKNVLVVVLESTRYDATSAYVPRLQTTPHLAKLAQAGMRVNNAYTDIPHTSKALVSILCGYSPQFSVEIREAQPGGLPTPCVAHVLGELGYKRAFFQAATGTYESRHQFAQSAGYEDIYTRESYDESGFEETNYLSMEDKIMVEPIMRWIDAAKDQPFFLSVLTCTTHHSYGTPTNFPLREYPRRPALTGGRMPRPWSDYNAYLNAVRYSDEFLGELVSGLRKRGKLDDTLIVVVGDHGQGFYEHGQKAHNTVIWDEGLHVPLVFYNRKAIPEPVRVDGVRRQVDIAPTIMAKLGISYATELFEGRSLLDPVGHEAAYSRCWYDDRCAAETTDTLRFIDHFDNQPMEVYDLVDDPFERRNLLRTGTEEERAAWEAKAVEARARIRARPAEVEKRFAVAADDAPYILKSEPVPQHRLRARLGDQLELLGYDTPSHDVKPDGFWEFNAYLKCLKRSDPGWRMFGRLETIDGRTEQVDHHPGNGRFYLEQCEPGTFLVDHVRVWIPGDFPPGKLRYLWGSVLLKENGHVRRTNPRLEYRSVLPLDRGVMVQGRALVLAELNVAADYRPELAKLLETAVLKSAPKIAQPLNVRFRDGLTLLEAKVTPTEARRLSSVTVTTVWQVDEALEGPWQVLVHLDSDRPGYWFRRTHSAVDGIHPVANWKPGTWVVDTHILPIAQHMPRDKATVWVGIRDERRRMRVSDEGRAEVLDHRVKAGVVDIVQ